jgi:hypothetical protein
MLLAMSWYVLCWRLMRLHQWQIQQSKVLLQAAGALASSCSANCSTSSKPLLLLTLTCARVLSTHAQNHEMLDGVDVLLASTLDVKHLLLPIAR